MKVARYYLDGNANKTLIYNRNIEKKMKEIYHS